MKTTVVLQLLYAMKPNRSPSDMLAGENRSGLSFPAGQSVWGPKSGWRACQPPKRPYHVTISAPRTVAATEGASTGEAEDLFDDDPRSRRKRAEAVLLLSKASVTARKLAQLAHLADATQARTLVRDLNRIYDNLGRALRIESVAGGYRMLTRPSLAPWLTRLGHLPPTVRLSSPMMETLAVVAYRQTVSRADIEAVRGVACGELLRQLMEKDLIRIAGRGEELGRPYLYGTTKRFLQLFGLPDVNALPPIHWQALQEDTSTDALSSDDSTEVSSTDVFPSSEIQSSTDSTTSPKEPVVSTVVAPVLSETLSAVAEADQEQLPMAVVNEPDLDVPHRRVDPQAVIEDEEDDLYGDNDDDEDIDEEMDDDDWDEDDDDLDEEEIDDDDDDDELDDEDDDWEEVDDDLEDEDDDEELDEEEIDDEDWDDDDEEDEDWDDDEEEEEEEWD